MTDAARPSRQHPEIVLDVDDPTEATRSRQLRLAFWINTYNAAVARGIDRLAVRKSVWEIRDFFGIVACRVGDLVVSADDIEHGVLRANRPSPLGGPPPFGPDDPRRRLVVEPMDVRMHFAISCGARSCPPVRRYDGDRLDVQLDEAVRSYLERELTIEDDVLCAPELFRWFRDDFERCPGGLRAFLVRHAPPGPVHDAVTSRGVAIIEYRPYDWRLP